MAHGFFPPIFCCWFFFSLVVTGIFREHGCMVMQDLAYLWLCPCVRERQSETVFWVMGKRKHNILEICHLHAGFSRTEDSHPPATQLHSTHTHAQPAQIGCQSQRFIVRREVSASVTHNVFYWQILCAIQCNIVTRIRFLPAAHKH